MAAGCLAGQEAAWREFVSRYLPVAGAVIGRHFPHQDARRQEALLEVLSQAREQDGSFFREYQGQSERDFLVHLRELALRAVEDRQPPPEIPLEWETFERALGSLSAIDRQVIWLLILRPGAIDIDRILSLPASTVAAKIDAAQDLLRQGCDRWSASLLEENSPTLRRTACERRTEDCPDPRRFLRLLDGQITWRDREETEQHLAQCWRCVDALCRLREAVFLQGQARPLEDAVVQSCWKALGLEVRQPPLWRRALGRRAGS